MKSNKCDISQLKAAFPQKNFEPWSSEGESLLAKHGCDVIAIPSKNGVQEHLVGNKINANIFVANGYIQPIVSYEDEGSDESGSQIRVLRKEKIVVTGQNGSGAVFLLEDADKIVKNLKKIVNND